MGRKELQRLQLSISTVGLVRTVIGGGHKRGLLILILISSKIILTNEKASPYHSMLSRAWHHQ